MTLVFYLLKTKDTMTVLQAKNLKKSYGRRTVVKGITIECNAGEIIGLLGRNGAGKTTTFQMMVGLIKPDKGEIFLDNNDISEYSTNKRSTIGITYLPQENSVFMKTTVEKNIFMILELLKFNKKEKIQRTKILLEELGLLHLARQSAHSLSGGERRRLEIGRSLAITPKFLLLDEPFTGIDPITIRELQKILDNLRSRGIGIILSDHNVRDTFQITDRVYIINEGEILVQGTPEKITADARAREYFLGKNFKYGEEVQLNLFEEKGGLPGSPPEKNKTEKNTSARKPPAE